MLTLSVRNSRQVPDGPIVEATLTIGVRRWPWVHFHARRYPKLAERHLHTGKVHFRPR